MKVDVLKTDGSKAGRTVDLPETVFGIEPNDHAIYLAVKQYQANQRQGTHKTKEKSEVSGSTRKLHRQKGTGGSRKGSIKNPLYPGGGRIFGPKPRDYSFKLNKKVKDLAKKSALTYKAKDNAIAVVEDFKLDDNKTKNYFQILKNLGVSKSKTLVVVGEADKNLRLASRNVSNSRVTRASDLNTYDILNCKSLLLTEGSLKNFEN
ncbi:MAG: 50S ribosomal protein L4 [Chitinophagales bacterium]|nr:50S ribosomal protein L4 [Bacteroidota bacterium]MBX7139948.1 50S ribosomal protein L4 [Chitinophagales bacterium]